MNSNFNDNLRLYDDAEDKIDMSSNNQTNESERIDFTSNKTTQQDNNDFYQNNKQRGSAGLIVFIVILCIAVVGLVGYIAYDKITTKDNAMQTTQTGTNTNTDKNEGQEIKANVTVSDGISFTDDWSKTKQITIPIIVDGGKNSHVLNTKIATDMLKISYGDLSGNVTTKYRSVTKNGVLAIYAELAYDRWTASGDGINRFFYFYDIENDKELLLGEAAEKMGYALTDIKTIGDTARYGTLTNFSELNKQSYVNYCGRGGIFDIDESNSINITFNAGTEQCAG